MESWDNGYSIVPPTENRNPQGMNFLQISAHTIRYSFRMILLCSEVL